MNISPQANHLHAVRLPSAEAAVDTLNNLLRNMNKRMVQNALLQLIRAEAEVDVGCCGEACCGACCGRAVAVSSAAEEAGWDRAEREEQVRDCGGRFSGCLV